MASSLSLTIQQTNHPLRSASHPGFAFSLRPVLDPELDNAMRVAPSIQYALDRDRVSMAFIVYDVGCATNDPKAEGVISGPPTWVRPGFRVPAQMSQGSFSVGTKTFRYIGSRVREEESMDSR